MIILQSVKEVWMNDLNQEPDEALKEWEEHFFEFPPIDDVPDFKLLREELGYCDQSSLIVPIV